VINLKAKDKEKIIPIAFELGLPVPKSICPNSVEKVSAQIADFKFPVFIKAGISSGMQKGL
jgi:carbamoylphosphate synthase large subunit